MKQLAPALLAALLALPFAVPADDISKVNRSIRVNTGETVDDVSTVNGSIDLGDSVRAGDVETVNGSIEIGRDAVVRSVDTVNGRITIGENGRADSVGTVNGAIELGARSQVAGAVENVNGAVRIGLETSIGRNVENVNGRIALDRAQVGGRLKTTNGDIDVGAGSHVKGGIFVEKPNRSWFSNNKQRIPRIVIGPNAIVEGDLKFEHEVELYVSTSAKVGRIEGAQAIPFSGDAPRSEKRTAEAVER